MAMQVMFYFGLVALLATSHYFTSPSSWQQTRLFGGLLNPPTPGRDFHLSGELSFLTWIFHYSMMYDYIMILRCMWRWSGFTNKKWKLYSLLHIPACLVNAIVVINHLHRDQIGFLRVLHPILVFVGSITTCYGACAIARENGWGTTGQHSDGLKNISLSLKSKSTKLIQGSNRLHTLTSFFIASLFAYWSLYLTV